MTPPEELPPAPMGIDARIFTVRGQSVMLDSDLAVVYEVTTKQLNQAIKRNEDNFPERYSFQLSENEWDILRSQFVTSSVSHGGRRYPPRVFTEHGAVMLASVLNSDRVVAAVVDAFVRLRRVLDSNKALARKVEELAEKVGEHDAAFAVVFKELRELTQSWVPEKPKGRIGFNR